MILTWKANGKQLQKPRTPTHRGGAGGGTHTHTPVTYMTLVRQGKQTDNACAVRPSYLRSLAPWCQPRPLRLAPLIDKLSQAQGPPRKSACCESSIPTKYTVFAPGRKCSEEEETCCLGIIPRVVTMCHEMCLANLRQIAPHLTQ